jgi:hypothetical protein
MLLILSPVSLLNSVWALFNLKKELMIVPIPIESPAVSIKAVAPFNKD